jgi:hypothetical protein
MIKCNINKYKNRTSVHENQLIKDLFTQTIEKEDWRESGQKTFLMKRKFTENHWWMVPDTSRQTLNHLLITLIVNYGVDCKFVINK